MAARKATKARFKRSGHDLKPGHASGGRGHGGLKFRRKISPGRTRVFRAEVHKHG